MKKISSFVNKIAGGISYISFAGVIVMMLLITVDVILRKFFRTPIEGSYEIVQYILMILVFASFAYTQAEKKQVRVTLFLGLMPWRLHVLLMGIWELICAIGVAICSYAAFVQAAYLVEKNWTSDVLRFKVAPFHYFEGVVMAVFAVVLLIDAIRYFLGLRKKEEAMECFKDYT